MKQLSRKGREAYIDLLGKFYYAKKNKQYAESDRIRLELQKWQGMTSDQEFMEMHETGLIKLAPYFMMPEIRNNKEFFDDCLSDDIDSLKHEVDYLMGKCGR